jgi:hypothetical protein
MRLFAGGRETPAAAVPRGPPPERAAALERRLPRLIAPIVVRRTATRAKSARGAANHPSLSLSLNWSLAATHQRRANTRHLFVHVLSYLYSAHVHSSQANAIPVCTQTNSVVTVVRDLG